MSPLIATRAGASARGFGLFASLGDSYWIGLLGSPSNGFSVAVDAAKNVYVCGHSDASGSNDFQLAKYNSLGILQWQRRLGGSTSDIALSISADASGNVYVTGYSDNAGSYDSQIAKYNTAGTLQWQNRLGAASIGDFGASIVVDGSSNVYVAGYSSASGSNDFQLAKYNSSGTLQWQRRLGGSGADICNSVAVDPSGNIYICGHSNASGTYDLLLAKYDTSGTLQWQRLLGNASFEQGYGFGVTTDASSNVYVCGYNDGSGTGYNEMQLAKYDTSGTLQWQRRLGGTSANFAYSINADASGNVYIAGESNASGTTDFQLAKYDTSGTLQWQRRLGGSGADSCRSVTLDASGNVYVCGTSTTSSSNILLAKLPPTGAKTGTYALGAYSYTYAATTLTSNTSTLTAGVSSLTSAASSLTSAASSLTDAATSLTSTVTTI